MDGSVRNRLIELVRADKGEMATFTRELVAIPSENPPGAHYGSCVEALSNKLFEIGIEHNLVPIPAAEPGSKGEEPRSAILAHLGVGDPLLHFHGHFDVVPATDDEQFRPIEVDGNLFGRGSSDMKSGLAAMIYAVKAIKTCGIDLHGSIRLVFVPDEETGGVLGSKFLSENGLIAESGVAMFTPEPTSGVIWNASRGAISLEVTVKGVPMHVGLQHQGVNAFDGMIKAANALTELKRDVETRVSTYNIQPDSARRSILMLGGRCDGGTNFNVVPGECSFTIDRRINPEEDLNTEKERLFDILDGFREDGMDLDVEVLQEGGSAGVPEGTPIAQSFAGNVERVTGKRPAFEMCPGLLEIRFYAANGIPAFAYGPGLLSVSHGPLEYVPINNIVDCAATYALTAFDILAT